MACDATARLYDVDEDTVVFKKLDRSKKYDQGTIRFRARKGRLIDLAQLHESVWATRLSGGTRSGLVSLQVDVRGRVVKTEDGLVLDVEDSEATFILQRGSESAQAATYDRLAKELVGKPVTLTGTVANYRGRWPQVLKTKPPAVRRLIVEKFQPLDRVE